MWLAKSWDEVIWSLQWPECPLPSIKWWHFLAAHSWQSSQSIWPPFWLAIENNLWEVMIWVRDWPWTLTPPRKATMLAFIADIPEALCEFIIILALLRSEGGTFCPWASYSRMGQSSVGAVGNPESDMGHVPLNSGLNAGSLWWETGPSLRRKALQLQPVNRFIMMTWPQKVKEQNLTHSGISPDMLGFVQNAFQKGFRTILWHDSNSITVLWSSRWWTVASAVISTYSDLSLNTKCQPHGGTRGKHWPTWIPSSHLANVAKGAQNVTNQQLLMGSHTSHWSEMLANLKTALIRTGKLWCTVLRLICSSSAELLPRPWG